MEKGGGEIAEARQRERKFLPTEKSVDTQSETSG